MCSGRWAKRFQLKRSRRCSPSQSGGGVMRRGPNAVTTSVIWLAPDLTATVKLDRSLLDSPVYTALVNHWSIIGQPFSCRRRMDTLFMDQLLFATSLRCSPPPGASQ